jgi:hypothetical protein
MTNAGQTKPRRLLVNICTAFCATLVAFAGLEIALRLSGVADTDWRSNGPGNRRILDAVRRNSLGFRDRDYPGVRPPPGVTRLTLLGDSFAFGAGIAGDNAIFPELLENEWNARGRRVQIMNASQAGAGTWKELALYRGAERDFHAQFVLLVFFANDVETTHNSALSDRVAAPSLPLPAAWSEHSYLLHFLNLRARILQERMGRRMSYGQYVRALYADPDTLGIHDEAMEYLAREVAQNGAKLIVAYLPLIGPRGGDMFPEAAAHIRMECRRVKAPLIDLAPALAALPPDKVRLSNHDAHLSARAHRAVAGALAKDLVPYMFPKK